LSLQFFQILILLPSPCILNVLSSELRLFFKKDWIHGTV
jgi:hypothetical protein